MLAALAALAAPRGIADLVAFSARQHIAQLEARNQLPSAAEWLDARERLQRAIELDPQNPAHYELLARWYERYATRLPRSSAVGVAYLEQSAAHLRHALAGHPGSAYAWANLATVKLRLGQFDAELDTSIARARQFGPHEPDVQLALARILTILCSGSERGINAGEIACAESRL